MFCNILNFFHKKKGFNLNTRIEPNANIYALDCKQNLFTFPEKKVTPNKNTSLHGQ